MQESRISDEDAGVVNEIAIIAFGWSPESMTSRKAAAPAVHAMALTGALLEQDARCREALSPEVLRMVSQVLPEWVMAMALLPDGPGMHAFLQALTHVVGSLAGALPLRSLRGLLAPFGIAMDAHAVSHAGKDDASSMASSMREAVGDLHAAMRRLRGSGGLGRLLHCLLTQPLQAPLLVLHPGQRRGWLTEVSGVTDMQQLHTLLAHALHRQAGSAALFSAAFPPPATRAVHVMCGGRGKSLAPQELGEVCHACFDFYQPASLLHSGCRAWLQGAATEPPGALAHVRVPDSAVLGDLQTVAGLQVLVLGPPTEHVTWRCCRMVPSLHAKVSVAKVLEDAEVAQWMAAVQDVKQSRPPAGGSPGRSK